jgi:hypothetical protein
VPVEEPSTASNSDLDAPKREVRFAPINGHRQLAATRQINCRISEIDKVSFSIIR